MPFLRRSLILVAMLIGVSVLAGSGIAGTPDVSLDYQYGARGSDFATPVCGGYYPFTLHSPHFVVHYDSNVDNIVSIPACDHSRAITETQAGDVLGWAEKAYTAEITDYGYPAPLSDGVLGGDSRIDIYITSEIPEELDGVAWPDGGPPLSSGSIDLNAVAGLNPATIAHELFHLIQFGMWIPATTTNAGTPGDAEYWLFEETAAWMSAKVNGYPDASVDALGPSDIALDCKDHLRTNKCDLSDEYTNGGSSRWPFWQSVTQTYGVGFVREVFQHAHDHNDEIGVAALEGALLAHGSNLADAFTTWTVQAMSGTYGLDVLDQVKPKVWTVVSTGVRTTEPKDIPQRITVPVNHLASRLIEFDRGDGSGGGGCFAATLDLTVNVRQSGIGARPYFYWNGLNNKPVPLTVNGDTASGSIPWDTCTWSLNQGYLSLPNPTSTDKNANGVLFDVDWKLTVHTDEPAQASAPPVLAPIKGVVPVTGDDVAPTLLIFGPELLRVNASAPTVRLIVRSSSEGRVRASLGSVVLGTVSVRPGGNDIRFTIPKSLLNGLRRSSSAAGNLLTLTPLAESGPVTGTPVTRKVSVTAAKKAVVKKKLVKKR